MARATLKQVERALDSLDPATGAIVADADGRVLADRDALPGGGAVLIFLNSKPFSYPKRTTVKGDARRQPECPADRPREGQERVSRPPEPTGRGDSPTSPTTGPERLEESVLLADDRD